MAHIITKYNDIVKGDFALSSSMYKQLKPINTNTKLVRELLYRNLLRKDLGSEVGTINYVDCSHKFFIKTKALQKYSYLPIFTSEAIESIHPNSFINHNLKEGDIIISKDSNIGEAIILDTDYPNHMLSGALYKLPIIEEYRYYLLAFLKHDYFRTQLDILVPKGVTIRHAGTKFLDCNIPLPNKNTDEEIKSVSSKMKLIIDCEVAIKAKLKHIDELFAKELFGDASIKEFSFRQPTFKELVENSRIDTGIYSKSFKLITHAIKSYKRGYFFIEPSKIKSGSTPKIRIEGNDNDLKYSWVTPTNCSDYGYILIDERIDMPTNNNLNHNAMLLINRTSKGGQGEYVGIATYYDAEIYGVGHHNQGIYQITGYSNEDLLYMTCFMNSSCMRKYCSFLCMGTKMKEIKMNQFSNIPIPNINPSIKKEILALFNGGVIGHENIENTNLNKMGVLKIFYTLKNLRKSLSISLESIINEDV